MAHIAVIGAGHVGTVYAAGLASLAHDVALVDIDRRRVAQLRAGKIPFYEPGLVELFRQGLAARRISVTTDYRRGLARREFVFLCVPSPITEDGSLDDSFVTAALRGILGHTRARARPIVVNKSTVPVGTGDNAAGSLHGSGIRIVSNPEFLAEGRALDDFFHPTRVVIGSQSPEDARSVAALYEALGAPVLITDLMTAELVKLGSNAFLATKISFANALAQVGQRLGADLAALRRGLELDPRIGAGHLRPGLGYGGSCLPKDLAALEHVARRLGAPYDLFAATAAINRYQRARVVDHLRARLGRLDRARVAILGAAFKAGTDDLRESPALALGRDLLELRATVTIWDPHAQRKALAAALPGARPCASALSAARGADAVVVATEWPEIASLDLARLRRAMRGMLFVDGRGVFGPQQAKRAGLDYFGFGLT